MEIRRQWSAPAAGIRPQTYSMSFLAKGRPLKRPLLGCPGRVATRIAMRLHFVHRHVLDTVVLMEEGNSPHPWCARCDMLVPWRALNRRHLGIAHCKKGSERNRQ